MQFSNRIRLATLVLYVNELTDVGGLLPIKKNKAKEQSALGESGAK